MNKFGSSLLTSISSAFKPNLAARSVTQPIRSITMASTTKNAGMKKAEDFIDFLNASPTPFHAVRSSYRRLEAAGFTRIHESSPWSSTLEPGGKYYLTRNSSTIIAFTIGQQWRPGNPIAMIGAHTDSPCLRIKPVSKRTSDGFLQVGVETYGGGWWATWFDRDLSVAGRVMVQKQGTDKIEQRLVRINKPICRIPNLAVHFGGSVPFEFNKESNLLPICGLVAAELNRTGQTPADANKASTAEESSAAFSPLKPPTTRHHPRLIELLAKSAECAPSEIVDLECVLYDTQPACLGGLNDEFIFSARLDNLGMTYCAVEGLISSLRDSTTLDSDPSIRLIACFDHEEIGSTSAQGAASNILPAVLRRLSTLSLNPNTSSSDPAPDAFEQSLSKSFLISADMAHSLNPSYAGKHESQHQPLLNAGPVLKINANVRYATNSPGIVLLQRCAAAAKPLSITPPGSAAEKAAKEGKGLPLQLFVVRNDSPCGSTIGPMLSASLGVRTLDLGNPQLAMHSIRETGGAWDVEAGCNLFESFLVGYGAGGWSGDYSMDGVEE